MGLLFAGKHIFSALGQPEPTHEYYKYVQENKMTAFAGLFLFNNLMGGLTQTGAFEITLDGDLVFSKIKEGRMPQLKELLEALHQKGVLAAPGRAAGEGLSL